MGTLISTAGGFTNLPATPPAGWPSNLTWPASASPNGAKTMTMSDGDYQKLLAWVGNTANAALGGTTPPAPPAAVTPLQLLQAWLQIWATGSVNAEQQFATQPVAPPTPISITIT